MARVFDNSGHELNGIDFGASLWEITHPGQVQQEAGVIGVVGAPPPSYFDIWGNAFSDIGTNIQDNAKAVGSGLDSAFSAAAALVPWIVVGIIVVAVNSHLPKEKRK